MSQRHLARGVWGSVFAAVVCASPPVVVALTVTGTLQGTVRDTT